MPHGKTARVRAGRLTLLCALLAALVSGCATISSQPPTSDAITVAPPRLFYEKIDISGRLGLRYDLNGNPQSLDGKFTWTQTTGLTHITLLTPFGQTLATIDVTPQTSTLMQAGQPPRSAASVDELTATALGWPLPIAGLRDWLQGFATGAGNTPYVASARASVDAAYIKTADGWLIHYPVWEAGNAGDIGARPRRIDLQRTTTEAGKVSLRIILDQWQPH